MNRRYYRRTRRAQPGAGRTPSRYEFESLGDWYAAADEYNKKQFRHVEPDRVGFTGATDEEIRARAYGYQDAVDYISALPEMNEPIRAAEYKKTWNEDDGDEMDMDRFREGLPFIRRRVKDRGSRKTSGTVAIFVNLAEHGGVSQHAMRCKAYAAARIADQIEAAGPRVEVFGVISADRTKSDGSSAYIKIRIKADQEPMNLSSIAAALMPWQLRYWYFRFSAAHWVPGRGYGIPGRIIRDDPDAIYIESGDCLTMESARRFVKEVEEKRQAAAHNAA